MDLLQRLPVQEKVGSDIPRQAKRKISPLTWKSSNLEQLGFRNEHAACGHCKSGHGRHYLLERLTKPDPEIESPVAAGSVPRQTHSAIYAIVHTD